MTTETLFRPSAAALESEATRLEALLAEALRVREACAFDALSGSRRSQALLEDAEGKYRAAELALQRVKHAMAGARAYEAEVEAEQQQAAVAETERQRTALLAQRAAVYADLEARLTALAETVREAVRLNREIIFTGPLLGISTFAGNGMAIGQLGHIRGRIIHQLAAAGLRGGDWPTTQPGWATPLVAAETAVPEPAENGDGELMAVNDSATAEDAVRRNANECADGHDERGRFNGRRPGPGRGHKSTST